MSEGTRSENVFLIFFFSGDPNTFIGQGSMSDVTFDSQPPFVLVYLVWADAVNQSQL